MKSLFKWLIAGGVILGVGLIILIIGLALNGWSLGGNFDYEQREFTAVQPVDKLELSAAAGKVYVRFYDGEAVTVSYPFSDRFAYTVAEQDGKVKIGYTNSVWFFGFWQKRVPDTVVQIPYGCVLDVETELNAGNLTLESGTYGRLKLEIHAGTLNVGDIVCDDCTCEVNAGTLNIRSISAGQFEADVSAGSAVVKNLRCGDIKAEVSAGSLSLSVEGDKSDYAIYASHSAGSCNVTDQTGNGSGKRLTVNVSAGSIAVNFTD